MKLLIICLFGLMTTTIASESVVAQTNASPTTPADLRKLADDYYNWRNQNYPVFSSDAGLHTWDDKLTDYSLSRLLARRLHVRKCSPK